LIDKKFNLELRSEYLVEPGEAYQLINSLDYPDMAMQPLPYQMEPLKFEIFSILPPQGDHWCRQIPNKSKGSF
jgi:hypothetical protein